MSVRTPSWSNVGGMQQPDCQKGATFGSLRLLIVKYLLYKPPLRTFWCIKCKFYSGSDLLRKSPWPSLLAHRNISFSRIASFKIVIGTYLKENVDDENVEDVFKRDDHTVEYLEGTLCV
jgi:hypothetical protein